MDERGHSPRQACLSIWQPRLPQRGAPLGQLHPQRLQEVQAGSEPQDPWLVPLWEARAQHQRRRAAEAHPSEAL